MLNLLLKTGQECPKLVTKVGSEPDFEGEERVG